jgi:hypothetical protein
MPGKIATLSSAVKIAPRWIAGRCALRASLSDTVSTFAGQRRALNVKKAAERTSLIQDREIQAIPFVRLRDQARCCAADHVGSWRTLARQ